MDDDSSTKSLLLPTQNGGWLLSPIESMVGQRHPLAFVVLIPVFILLARLLFKWLHWLQRLILKSGGGVSPGLFMPRHVQGSVHPYGVVELKGRRPYMEDRHVVVPNMLSSSGVTVYSVFDGHGGDAAAQYCADYIGSVLSESPSSMLCKPQSALSFAFKTIDQRFLELAHMRKMDDGTTALVVLANGRQLTVANAGDSRAVVMQRGGRTMPLSRDHKPDRNDERDRIARLGGSVVHWGVWRVEGILAVSRAIGDRLLKDYVIPDPEFVTWTCGADDIFLVLATDGLWDVVNNDQVGKLLDSVNDPQAAAELLTQKAFEAGTQDNVTVLVVDLRNAASKAQYSVSNNQENSLKTIDASSTSISSKLRDKTD